MIRSALYLLGLFLVFIIATPFIVIPTLYLFGIICYDGPIGAPASTGNVILGLLWLIALLVGLFKTKGVKQRSLVALLAAAVVIGPWMTIQPSNDRDWKPEFGETGWVDVEDDVIVFHNFRNFDYDSEWNEIVNWETRTHHLDELVGIDYFHDAFGGDLIAHPIISFDFGEEGNVCLSIETRREKSESYSELGGLYKMFELQYIFGSEEDLIRLRTNVRDEPVYLYRMNVTKDQARDILFESIAVQNEMRDKPRWYNVLTANCTTSMRAQTPEKRRRKFDIRMLINGKLDEYVHEQGMLIDEGLSFPELRPKCLINEAARAQPQAEGFSKRIRKGRPGFEESAN
jgi:hypothetical protein